MDGSCSDYQWDSTTLTYSHDTGIFITGDFTVECYNRASHEEDRRVIFRFQGTTYFLEDGDLDVKMKLLDIVDPEATFKESFRFTLVR